MLVSTDKGLYCLANDSEWRDSNKFQGGIESLCLEILPEYKIAERNLPYHSFSIYD